MLAYLFLIFAVAFRFAPHTLGFTPVGASLLFFGSKGSRRQMWLPLLLLAGADVVLTKVVYAYPFSWDHFVTWAWYAAILWLGTRLGRNPRPLPVLGASLASSVSFFLISNFAVWAAWTDTYPRSLNGLMTCYAVGLPYFRRGLEGDLLFTAAMFATPVAIRAVSQLFEKAVGDRSSAA